MSGWVVGAAKVFPLLVAEQAPYDSSEFPRSIDSDSLVIRCDSGWMRVTPGTGESHPAYGYIHISLDGEDLAVYHLWGEV